MEELCIPLQDFLQDSCKILNFFITRVLVRKLKLMAGQIRINYIKPLFLLLF